MAVRNLLSAAKSGVVEKYEQHKQRKAAREGYHTAGPISPARTSSSGSLSSTGSFTSLNSPGGLSPTDEPVQVEEGLLAMGYSIESIKWAMGMVPGGSMYDYIDLLADAEGAEGLNHKRSSLSTSRSSTSSLGGACLYGPPTVLPVWALQDMAATAPGNPKRRLGVALFQITAKYSYYDDKTAIQKFTSEWGWEHGGSFGKHRAEQAVVFIDRQRGIHYVGFTPALVGAWAEGGLAAKRVLHVPALELAQMLRRKNKMESLNPAHPFWPAAAKLAQLPPDLAVNGDVLKQHMSVWDGGLAAYFASAAPTAKTIYLLGYSFGAAKAQMTALVLRIAYPHLNIKVMTWGGIRWMNESLHKYWEPMVPQSVQFVSGTRSGTLDPACGWPSTAEGFTSVPRQFGLHRTHGLVKVIEEREGLDNDWKHTLTGRDKFQVYFLKMHFSYQAAMMKLVQMLGNPAAPPLAGNAGGTPPGSPPPFAPNAAMPAAAGYPIGYPPPPIGYTAPSGPGYLPPPIIPNGAPQY